MPLTSLAERLHAATRTCELRQALLLLLLAISAVALAERLRPTEYLAGAGARDSLHDSVPISFGDWRVDKRMALKVVNPQVEQKLAELYSDILVRTYVNSNGDRIMLSIAYGTDQSDAHRLHYPDACYPAQGFTIRARTSRDLVLAGTRVPAVQMEAVLGQRYEPLTYWSVIGEHVARSRADRKLTQMRYSVKGQIPDGLIFRVSSIDPDSRRAYALQEAFIQEMFENLPKYSLRRFAGTARAE